MRIYFTITTTNTTSIAAAAAAQSRKASSRPIKIDTRLGVVVEFTQQWLV